MKIQTVVTAVSVSLASVFYAQTEVSVVEQMQTFSIGSKNALVVTIPHANRKIVDSELKSLMKDWGGKYSASKKEGKNIQATPKFLDKKAIDVYTITSDGSDGAIKIAFGIDLGGAFLTSNEHNAQFTMAYRELQQFATETALKCVNADVKAESKVLSGLEKEQKKLEKEKSSLEKDINNYKKKIEDAEKKIKENESNQSKKKSEIDKQKELINQEEKKAKKI